MNRRLTSWLLLVLAGTMLSGCAALDLLGGHLPGKEEDLEPPVDVRPYPPPQHVEAERPEQQESADTAVSSQPPAPIVNAPVTAPAATGSQAPTQPQAPAQPAASADKPDEAQPAATTAAATTAPPESKPPTEQSASDATTDEEKSEPTSDSAKAEPTAEERLADLLRRRDELIAALEQEVQLRSGKQDVDGELRRMQQQLRLLYLLAERPDDAVGEIESLPAAEQEAFKQVMFGLSTWLSADEERRPTLRNARVLRSLKDASAELAAAAKLDVKNLRFCESVEGFGWYKEFPTAQFRAKQQVILYAEVDNFASQKKGPDTYETELAVSYQIFDDGGTLVDERELPLDKEVCRNQRRDYFLAYRIYLPDGIGAGRYRLELTVEDLKAKEHYQGRKLGDGQIEFSIR
ncbi:MAG TPA: hypothetical protein VMP01_22350 [Pirellulaceae bacterium]|nr:hypothetical protein [Pirellulaceae bacterium]